jgi:hypothetical protein
MKLEKVVERRLNERSPIDREVLLYYPGLGMLRCCAKDLSSDGAYIETGQMIIPATVDVDLMFNQPQPHVTEVYRLEARVVRSHGGGVGVNFTNYCDGTYQFLQQLIVS